jgi:hypothetical protein
MSLIRRRAAIAGIVVGLALALAGAALAADPTAGFPAGWTHIQVNVVGARGKGHTEIFDRGRAQSVTASSVTLLESDSSVVTIQVGPAAVVLLNGRRVSFSQVAPGYLVWTLGIDGKPAQRVVATKPPTPKPRIVRPVLKRRAATTTTSSASG